MVIDIPKGRVPVYYGDATGLDQQINWHGDAYVVGHSQAIRLDEKPLLVLADFERDAHQWLRRNGFSGVRDHRARVICSHSIGGTRGYRGNPYVVVAGGHRFGPNLEYPGRWIAQSELKPWLGPNL